MARVVREGYRKLTDPNYQPTLEQVTTVAIADEDTVAVTLIDLVTAGLIKPGDLLVPIDPERSTIAEVTDDGLISVGEHTYDTPGRAAKADGDEHIDGWDYWAISDGDTPTTLRTLAEMYRAGRDW